MNSAYCLREFIREGKTIIKKIKKLKKLLTRVENHDIITKLSRERNKKQRKKLLTDVVKCDNLS